MKLNSFNEKPDFNFFVPIDFEKGKNEKTGEKVMKIRGIASTADKDSEGEILDPTGFDLSRFLEIGYLNYNHLSKSDPSKVIGEPTAASITRNGDLYFEGFLYNGHSTAESVYQMAETLERNGSKRKIGLSIEGRALERNPTNPKHITKALLTGLAITMTPVNGATYMEIVKGTQKQDFTEYEEDMLQKAEDSKYIFEFSCDSKKYGITKTFEVEEIIEKGGKKAVVGEIRTLRDGSQYQKQGDSSWKMIKDSPSDYKREEPKKTWISFMNYKAYSKLPESIKKMTGEEVKSLLENKLKRRDNGMTPSSEKLILRDQIWDLQEILEAHKKAEEIQKDMTTSNTAALVPESLDGKKIKLEPEIRKAIRLGILPIENLLKKLKR